MSATRYRIGPMGRRQVLAGMAALPVVLTPPRLALAADPGRLSLTTGMREPWTKADKTGFTDLVVAELFRRLGLAAELSVNLAASRAIQLAEDGIDDGLAARVKGLEAKYPNLVAVPEPIFENDFVACSLGKRLEGTGWGALAPHAVAYIIGWQVFQNNLPDVRELTLAKDAAQLLSLLKAGRTDFILHERWQALRQAREAGAVLTVHEPPLARVPMFIYLHRRHADLVPRVAATLAEMKADGTHDNIATRAFAGLVPKAPP
ncbi:MAG: transporter substrate-binding domain-containing protein [Pseudomonadota bacterium]